MSTFKVVLFSVKVHNFIRINLCKCQHFTTVKSYIFEYKVKNF